MTKSSVVKIWKIRNDSGLFLSRSRIASDDTYDTLRFAKKGCEFKNLFEIGKTIQDMISQLGPIPSDYQVVEILQEISVKETIMKGIDPSKLVHLKTETESLEINKNSYTRAYGGTVALMVNKLYRQGNLEDFRWIVVEQFDTNKTVWQSNTLREREIEKNVKLKLRQIGLSRKDVDLYIRYNDFAVAFPNKEHMLAYRLACTDQAVCFDGLDIVQNL